MNSIAVAWKNQYPDDLQFLPSRQILQSNLNKKTIKKVQFNCPPSTGTPQAFESSKSMHGSSKESNEFSFNHDNEYMSSADNFYDKWADDYAEPLCTLRALIITFIIAILIIIAVAIILGVILGTIKHSPRVTTLGLLNVNTTSTTFASLVTSNVLIGSQSGPPCTSYTSIDDPTRNVAYTGQSYGCDNGPIFNASNHGAWIRFVGSSGDIVVQTPVQQYKCSAFLQIWFNGTLPTTLGTSSNGTMCFSSGIFTCFSNYTAEVNYCIGGFYIYLLKPSVFCSARYCTTSSVPTG
ncbi:unnamed protein product [Adineta ricciae]|uniref:Uncharacterized protein n=1 Tax=Adineta ricciae TaxID=249248 RepID=A0A814B5M0_ADIRI|nr:unnamed protein product [Adineta ricciae]CAF1611368.1 unnamed protein product [Adineta ricciae]